jgi:hypothetical protein
MFGPFDNALPIGDNTGIAENSSVKYHITASGTCIPNDGIDDHDMYHDKNTLVFMSKKIPDSDEIFEPLEFAVKLEPDNIFSDLSWTATNVYVRPGETHKNVEISFFNNSNITYRMVIMPRKMIFTPCIFIDDNDAVPTPKQLNKCREIIVSTAGTIPSNVFNNDKIFTRDLRQLSTVELSTVNFAGVTRIIVDSATLNNMPIILKMQNRTINDLVVIGSMNLDKDSPLCDRHVRKNGMQFRSVDLTAASGTIPNDFLRGHPLEHIAMSGAYFNEIGHRVFQGIPARTINLIGMRTESIGDDFMEHIGVPGEMIYIYANNMTADTIGKSAFANVMGYGGMDISNIYVNSHVDDRFCYNMFTSGSEETTGEFRMRGAKIGSFGNNCFAHSHLFGFVDMTRMQVTGDIGECFFFGAFSITEHATGNTLDISNSHVRGNIGRRAFSDMRYIDAFVATNLTVGSNIDDYFFSNSFSQDGITKLSIVAKNMHIAGNLGHFAFSDLKCLHFANLSGLIVGGNIGNNFCIDMFHNPVDHGDPRTFTMTKCTVNGHIYSYALARMQYVTTIDITGLSVHGNIGVQFCIDAFKYQEEFTPTDRVLKASNITVGGNINHSAFKDMSYVTSVDLSHLKINDIGDDFCTRAFYGGGEVDYGSNKSESEKSFIATNITAQDIGNGAFSHMKFANVIDISFLRASTIGSTFCGHVYSYDIIPLDSADTADNDVVRTLNATNMTIAMHIGTFAFANMLCAKTVNISNLKIRDIGCNFFKDSFSQICETGTTRLIANNIIVSNNVEDRAFFDMRCINTVDISRFRVGGNVGSHFCHGMFDSAEHIAIDKSPRILLAEDITIGGNISHSAFTRITYATSIKLSRLNVYGNIGQNFCDSAFSCDFPEHSHRDLIGKNIAVSGSIGNGAFRSMTFVKIVDIACLNVGVEIGEYFFAEFHPDTCDTGVTVCMLSICVPRFDMHYFSGARPRSATSFFGSIAKSAKIPTYADNVNREYIIGTSPTLAH